MSEKEFDHYAVTYDAALGKSLAVTGESRDFYAKGRIDQTARRVTEFGRSPRRILDFGCGDGANSPILAAKFQAESVLGVDVSSESIAVARRLRAGQGVSFFLADEWIPDGSVDLAYVNGVFHHIPPSERDGCLRSIARALAPSGLLALWENNPWNPGTRYVMSLCEFDRDAITINPLEAKRMLQGAGLRILRQDFLFFFPNSLRAFRPLESRLHSIPLGGQYMTLCAI